MQRPLLFDSVLFDLDGTLVATDRFWLQAARAGARRAFEELGLDRPLPERDEWLALIGHGLADGFEQLFGDLPEDQWRHVLARCEEEEHRLLNAGGATLMPGARSLLAELTVRGARLGIASNCARSYLDHMLGELRLGEIFHHAYCLESPGIGDKSDMIEALLADHRTRSAIMVGDRATDRDAAWANGLPHVHCAFGFAGADEDVEAEACIEDLGALSEVLDRRALWIASVLEAIGVRLDAPGPLVVGVTGGVAAGKSLFARDAARVLRAQGVPSAAVSLEGFRHQHASEPSFRADAPGAEVDLERLERDLLEPLERGAAIRLAPEEALEAHDGRLVPENAVVFLEGPYLLDPSMQSRLDRVLYLDLDEEVLWRRLQGREGRQGGLEALERLREGPLRAVAEHRERYAPETLADLVLDASNPLGPVANGQRTVLA